MAFALACPSSGVLVDTLCAVQWECINEPLTACHLCNLDLGRSLNDVQSPNGAFLWSKSKIAAFDLSQRCTTRRSRFYLLRLLMLAVTVGQEETNETAAS